MLKKKLRYKRNYDQRLCIEKVDVIVESENIIISTHYQLTQRFSDNGIVQLSFFYA